MLRYQPPVPARDVCLPARRLTPLFPRAGYPKSKLWETKFPQGIAGEKRRVFYQRQCFSGSTLCNFVSTPLQRHLVIQLIQILAQTESKTAQKGLPVLSVSCLFLGDEALEGEVTRQERNTPAHRPPRSAPPRTLPHLPARRCASPCPPPAARTHPHPHPRCPEGAGDRRLCGREAAGLRGRCPVPPAAGRSAGPSPPPARPIPPPRTHWLW